MQTPPLSVPVTPKLGSDKTSTSQAPLDASRLRTTLTHTPRSVPDQNVADNHTDQTSTCTDHMITVQWTAESGWDAPHLRPYGALELEPTSSVLHYATECFEGLKLYRSHHDQTLRLFRPARNCARMRRSASRVALPDFDPAQLQHLILALCAADGPKWLPRSLDKHAATAGPGRSLYLRPALIANDPALGVQAPRKALLFIILCFLPNQATPVPQRLEPSPESQSLLSGEKKETPGLRLLASEPSQSIRAWPGGFGASKVGANYGPTLAAQGHARARGFNQVLWLFGDANDLDSANSANSNGKAYVTEAGASNFFVVWKTKDGRLQLVTAPLEDGIILEGVTRDSILALARERLSGPRDGNVGHDGRLEVVERRYTIQEVQEAAAEGRLVEAFASGTAYFVASVGVIEFQGREIEVPVSGDGIGKFAGLFKGWLEGIMFGKEEHEWAVRVPEEV